MFLLFSSTLPLCFYCNTVWHRVAAKLTAKPFTRLDICVQTLLDSRAHKNMLVSSACSSTHMHVYTQTHTCAHKHTVSLVACLQLELRNLTLKVVQLFCHSGQHTRSLSLPCVHMFPPVHFYLHVGYASASHPANCCPLLYFYKMMEYQPHLGSINSFFKQHWNKWVLDQDEWEEDWRSRLGLKSQERWLVRSRKHRVKSLKGLIIKQPESPLLL